MDEHPILRQTVFDAVDARALAEFYRRLLGLRYRIGDEPPDDGGPDPQASHTSAASSKSHCPIVRVAKSSPSARAIASPSPESCVRKLTRITSLSNVSLSRKPFKNPQPEQKFRSGPCSGSEPRLPSD